MKRSNTLRKIWSLFLTLAMVLTMGITALPSYAAGSGTAEVYYPPAAEGKVATTFTLYKVGHFERYKEGDAIPDGNKVGDSYLALDKGMPDSVNVRIRKSDYTDEEGNVDTKAWTAAWQEQASSLASIMKRDGISAPTFTSTEANKDNGGNAVFSGLEDGLYLVTGPMQVHKDTVESVNTYYTPSPSFIMVLNGKAELQVKFEIECIKEYILQKIWDDEGHEILRPTSVDVDLYRRDATKEYASEDEGWEFVETVTLSEKIDEKHPVAWTYIWKDEPIYQYSWQEKLKDKDAINYIVTEDVSMNGDNKKYVKLTNTYTKRKLKITKILDKFLENGDNSATFAFEIRGFMGKGAEERQVYTASAGINFAKDATGSLSTIVDNIPVNLTRLEVEEVYASNYKAVDGKVKDNGSLGGVTLNLDEGMYYVSFENDYNDEITIKGGIVNTYTNEEGEIVLNDENKDYGKTPAPKQ